ncbi:MAG TPA: ABC transporter permease [Chitinophagaceae bacterium]|nr:ABC transporter permease [Chitinophagaceae bacterium]
MWRNPTRTSITMVAIFFAVILSILTSSLREGIFDNLVKNVVSFYTGYLQVHRYGYQDEQILDNSFEATPSTEQKLFSEKSVSAVTPRLESFALASGDNITKGCLLVGIEPEKENQVSFLKNKIIIGEYLNGNSKDVLLSEGLANRLKLNVQDSIVLVSQGYHGATSAGRYRIAGIARFGSPDLNEKIIFMPLEAAQEFYGAKGMITAYILSLHTTRNLEAMATRLAAGLGKDFEVLTWSEIIPDIKQHIQTDNGNAKVVQGILYMLISFGIFGTLLMMMVERQFEMGMLVAIGMQKLKLMLLLALESILTVLSGCLLGILASIPVVYYFRQHPIKISGETAATYQRFGFEPVFPTSLDAAIFIRQGIIVLIIGLTLSLYTLMKAMLLNPVKAMKK